MPKRARLRMDSAAGRSVLLRARVGRIRHLEVKVVWAQDQKRAGRVVIEKCDGAYNVSDIGTKPLCSKVSERHREALWLFEAVKNIKQDLSWCGNGKETRHGGKDGMLGGRLDNLVFESAVTVGLCCFRGG